MSEIENIARNIVLQEEERQVEKIKLESEIKSLEEVLEHGISTDFVEDEVIYIYSQKTAHDMREKLYENYKQLHAQLTIPKSIADELDLINASEYENLIENFFESYNDSTSSERLDEFCRHPFNFNLCILYLVSIELGVDLVKVGEGN